MAAMGPIILSRIHKALFVDEVSVLDPTSITLSKKDLRRVCVPLTTGIGKTCLLRARLEFERRFCGNESGAIINARVHCNTDAALALMIDLRTCASAMAELGGLNLGMPLKHLGAALMEEYVGLWIEKEGESLAQAEAAAGCSTSGSQSPNSPEVDAFGFVLQLYILL